VHNHRSLSFVLSDLRRFLFYLSRE
jgi:hypothetical protein